MIKEQVKQTPREKNQVNADLEKYVCHLSWVLQKVNVTKKKIKASNFITKRTDKTDKITICKAST